MAAAWMDEDGSGITVCRRRFVKGKRPAVNSKMEGVFPPTSDSVAPGAGGSWVSAENGDWRSVPPIGWWLWREARARFRERPIRFLLPWRWFVGLISAHENRSGLFRRTGHVRAAFLAQGNLSRRSDRLLRQHRPGGRAARPRNQGQENRRLQNLH